MLKKDWRKNLLRVKQLADQNLGRAEKSEVLTEDLQNLEKRVDLIKRACQETHKRVSACMQGIGPDVEKRRKKLPEATLSHSMQELASLMGTDTLMGQMYQLCGEASGNLANAQLQFEMEVDKDVLQPVQTVLDNEIPTIQKLRKQLAKVTLDMDSARSRYHSAAKQTGGQIKTDNIRDEMEDASYRMEQCRDQLATDMYTFVSREPEFSRLMMNLVHSQVSYHRRALEVLEAVVPQAEEHLEHSTHMPVFGCGLEDHLRRTNRDIAMVIEDCVCTLLEIGMDEEGLFRVAGSSSKVKKLKAAFDSGYVDMSEYVRDIHCISGILKLYLRELPEPLTTFDLYQNWMEAAHLPANERLRALAALLKRLPPANYNNLRYLIKFLAKLTEAQDQNKMSSSNIAIVMGPNLIWPQGDGGPSVLSTSTQSAIVEVMISHAGYFFPEDIDFNATGGSTGSTGSPAYSASSISNNSNCSSTPGQLETAHVAGIASSTPPTGPVSSSSSPPTASQNNVNVPSTESGIIGSSPKAPRRGKKPAPLPPVHHERAPAPLPFHYEKSDRPAGAVTDHPHVTVSAPPSHGGYGTLERPPIPDRPAVPPPGPPEKPSSPRPDRPRGPPPNRPAMPPPPEKPEKPEKPSNKPDAPAPFQRSGSGRPPRPQPPPPPPPELRRTSQEVRAPLAEPEDTAGPTSPLLVDISTPVTTSEMTPL